MKRIILITLLNALIFTLLQAQNTQTVRGTVKDKSTNKPLEFATVTVKSTSVQGTVTDSTGTFVIYNVPTGRCQVETHFLGYESAVIKEVLVGSSKEVVLDVFMSESTHTLGEFTVTPQVNKSQVLNSMTLGSARTLGVEETKRYAGGFDDPARLAAAFAGVTSNIGDNGISVRGNSPKALQWRIENVEVPNPNHFADINIFGAGGMTAFSSQLLGNSDFLTGAFTADYGNALSGIFDMNLRNGNNYKHEHTVQLGVVGIDIASEGPFSKNASPSSYIFNYRYSTLALLGDILPDNAGGVKYQDLSFKLNFPTKKHGTISFWGLGLIDQSGQQPNPDSTHWEMQSDRNEMIVKQYMAATGLNHILTLKNDLYVKTSLATTVSKLDYVTNQFNQYLQLRPLNNIQNTQWNYILSTAVNKKFNRKHINKSGVKITGLNYNMLLQNAANNGQLTTVTNESGFSTLLAAYSNSSFKPRHNLTVNAGLHAQLFTLNNHYTIEPRTGIQWKFKPNQFVAINYGLHSKLEMIHTYFTKDPVNNSLINKDLDFTKAHHIVATYDWTPMDNYHLRIEPYLQQLFSIPVIKDSSFAMINSQQDWFVNTQLQNTGKGFNYGVDVTFEKYMQHGFYYMISASVFESKYKAGDGVWRNTRYNKNYVANFLTGKEWNVEKYRQNILSANVRIAYQGGDRYSPIDLPASQLAQDAVYNEHNAFTNQYPSMAVCHFTVSYKINSRHLAHELALKVINAGGSKEYLGHLYNTKTQQVITNSEVIIIPNISYKIEF